MESAFRRRNANFEELQERLLRLVRGRIGNGEFTERGLARMTGISQPQIHNYLKGARKLSPEFADRLMLRFDISILDLFEPSELLEQAAARAGGKKPVRSELSWHARSDHFGSGG
ncbi:MAG TPA: helix-turn-helix transcriptional regulator [Bryobacteraceae bacterium]